MKKRLLLKLPVSAAGAVAVIGIAILIFSFPAVAATFCPGCYGLVRLNEKLLVESRMPAETRDQLARDVDRAMIATTTFYGSFSGAPVIVACSTRECVVATT